MKKEEFIKSINLIEEFWSTYDDLCKLFGDSILECKLVSIPDQIFDILIQTNLTEKGSGILYHWLLETKEVEGEYLDANSLWEYLIRNKHVI